MVFLLEGANAFQNSVFRVVENRAAITNERRRAGRLVPSTHLPFEAPLSGKRFEGQRISATAAQPTAIPGLRQA